MKGPVAAAKPAVDSTPAKDEESKRRAAAEVEAKKLAAAKAAAAKAAAAKAAAAKAAADKLAEAGKRQLQDKGEQKSIDSLDAKSRRVEIGAVAPDSQIAVRGQLIVVAAGPASRYPDGGVHVLKASATELTELFVVPNPKGARASGVALAGDAVFYTLNSGTNDGRVVSLGLTGAYRWVRSFGVTTRSLPLVQLDAVGGVRAVWVVAGGEAQLKLLDLAPDTGAVRRSVDLVGCPAIAAEARLYVLDGRTLVVWCGADSAMRIVNLQNLTDQRELPALFKPAPTLVRGRVARDTQESWIFHGRGAIAGSSSDGAWRCYFQESTLACSPMARTFEAPAEQSSTMRFTLRDRDDPNGWARLDLTTAGQLTYRKGETSKQAKLNQAVTNASLGSFRPGGNWDIVAAGAGDIAVFETDVNDLGLARFPYGDLQLSGVTQSWLETPFEGILGGGSTSADDIAAAAGQNGAGGGFKLEALPSLPAAPSFGSPAGRALFGLGSVFAPVFEPKAKPRAGQYVTAHASGDYWYFPTADGVTSTDGTLSSQVWTTPKGGELRGFDAAGGSIAIVTDHAALWCLPNPGKPLTCETLLEDDLPGAVALSPDGTTYWLAVGQGEVRRWRRMSAMQPISRALGFEGNVGEIQSLRAFDAKVFAAGDTVTASFSVDSQPRLLTRQKFQAAVIERCDDRHTYALNDGQLVYADGDGDFESLSNQPAFIERIACDTAGSLVGISSRFGAFRLDAPPGWPWRTIALVLSPLLALGIAYVVFGNVNRGRVVAPEPPVDGLVGREVSASFMVDLPKQTIGSATDEQKALVHALRKFIDNEATSPPLTVGVYGEWGSGKSSVMRMLNDELQQTGRYVTVWFNAWRHHQEEQLGPALLQNIVREFRRQAGPRVRLNSLNSAIWRSRRTWYWFTAAAAFAIPSLGAYWISNDGRALMGLVGSVVPFWKSVVTPFVKLFAIEPADAADKTFSQRIGFLQEFSEEFERVVGALPKNHYLVIFVDDLDRCPPNRVTSVLESLNRLMESRLCFVVLGIDYETVRHCVELRYEKLINKLEQGRSRRSANFGNQFLEKLVGIGVNVPPVPAEELEQRADKEATQARDRALVDEGPGSGNRETDAVATSRYPRLVALLASVKAKLQPVYADMMKRLDQVFVTGMLAVAIGMLFVLWQQDNSRVESWIQTLVTLDGKASSSSARPVPLPSSEAPISKPGEEKPSDAPAEPKPVSTAEPADLGTPAPSAAMPPPAPSASSTAAPAPSGTAFVRTLTSQPSFRESPAVLRVEKERPESIAREYEAAASINSILVTGVIVAAALGCVLISLALRHDVVQKRRAPPQKDSVEFAAGLRVASRQFKNPRQRVRYGNLARLTYQLVATYRPKDADAGWDQVFFSLLAAQLLGSSYDVPRQHSWVQTALSSWLDLIATARPSQMGTPAPGTDSHPAPATSAAMKVANAISLGDDAMAADAENSG